MKTAQNIFSQISQAITARDQKALNLLCEIALNHRDVEILTPALWSMVFWKAEGLTRLKEIACSTDTSKHTSAALQILTRLSVEEQINEPLNFVYDHDLNNDLREFVNSNDLADLAKHQLLELILSKPTEDLLIPFSAALQTMSLTGPHLAETMVSALSAKWLRFGPQTVSHYDRMLLSKANNEAAFQDFFTKFPQFLDPMAVQVWSQPDLHGVLEPDFIIRRADNSYLVVEIECPAKKIVTKGNQVSASTTHAEKQAFEYKNFLIEHFASSQSYFPHFREPDCLIVIGLEESLNRDQKLALSMSNENKRNARTVGFDWLSQRAHSIISNVNLGDVDVIEKFRMY